MAQQRGGGLSSRRAHDQETAVQSLCQGLLDDVLVDDDDRYRAFCGYLQEWPDHGSACYTGFGAPPPPTPPGDAAVQETSKGNISLSCSGSCNGGSRKRKSDAHAYLDAKSECKRPRGKQQPCEPDEAAGTRKGKPDRPKAGNKKKAELALSKDPRAAAAAAAATAGQKTDYIHVRARRGQATDSHSLAERVRRERISERMRYLQQELVPGCNKVTGKAGMLDEIINYVQSLQKQVEFLSMKIAASNPVVSFNILEDLFGRQLNQQMMPPPPIRQQLEPAS